MFLFLFSIFLIHSLRSLANFVLLSHRVQHVLQRIRAANGVSTPWHELHAASGPIKYIVEYDNDDTRDQCKYRPFTTTAITKTVLFLLVLLLFVFMVSVWFADIQENRNNNDYDDAGNVR